MSGGNLISGDRLIDLDVEKMEILKKTFPAYTQAAKSVDLFDTNLSSAFALRVKKPFGDYTLASFFNSHETEPLARTFPLRRLWLAPEKTYLVWDFWKNQFLGEISGEISVRTEPASVTHLAIHEKRDAPQFLSSSRHILQGAVEVENFAWDESKQTLSGTSVAPAGTKNSVSVFLPARYFKNDPQLWTLAGSSRRSNPESTPGFCGCGAAGMDGAASGFPIKRAGRNASGSPAPGRKHFHGGGALRLWLNFYL
jgi:hypothetical protein